MFKGSGLLFILVVALAAALLIQPDQAGAQMAPCWTTGIVPGSVSIASHKCQRRAGVRPRGTVPVVPGY